MLLEGESAEGNTILFFFSFLFFHPALRFPLDLENRSLRVPVPNTFTFIYFFFFLRFRGSRNLLAFFSFFLSFFLAKERGKRETSVGRVEMSRMFRRTRGLLERVGGVRRVGRAKCKGARGRESPWRYYVQVHFDVNRFGKLVKISVATERREDMVRTERPREEDGGEGQQGEQETV